MTIQIQPRVEKDNSPDWMTWLNNGDQYFKAATPTGKKSRFGTDLRYNLLSMSLEGYIMAISGYHKNLPDNHTYTDLIAGLERVMPIAPSLKARILKHESIQSICSIENYHRSHPSETVLKELKEAIEEIAEIAHQTCSP